jgi:putative flippase GtrA
MSLIDRLPRSLQSLRAPLAFGVVGTLGFVVDAGVLAVLFHGFGFDHFSARALSFAVAVTTTWALNRAWTFRADRRASVVREYGLYLLAQSGGASINMAAYSLCIATMAVMAELPSTAVAVGSIAGMLFNYLSARHLVFRRSPVRYGA